MEKKFSVADFAELVGTTAKTIYQKIDNYENLPVNEQLATVKEKVKGREITFIVTSDEQIAWYKNLYGKNTVSEREYYENVTNNNSNSQVNNGVNSSEFNYNSKNNNYIFDKLMTLNETYLNRIETVTNELMEYKSKQLLLEDKAGKEGLYLKEINELKTDNEKLKTHNKILFTVLTVIISVLITVFVMLFIVNNIKSDQDTQKEPAQQEIVKSPVKPVKK
jgi:hypothetical protein